MKKSSILSKAGQQSLSVSQLVQPVVIDKQKSSQQYLKSSISNNLLQQVDDDYQEIEGYQSKYVDEQGNYVDQNGNIEASEQNITERQKKTVQKNIKSKLSNKPITEQSHHNTEDQQDKQSPIKQMQTQELSASQYSNQQNTIFSNRQRPGTLLKMSKYDAQLQEFSRLRNEKRNRLKQKQNQKSYLTNSRGLKQEDFYKLDYAKNGKYSKAWNTFDIGVKGSFFQLNNDLDVIEDILSEIGSMNKSSSQMGQNASKLFGKKVQPRFSSNYKNNKNFSSFPSNKKFNSSSISQNWGSKLDDLLFNYQFTDNQTSVKNAISPKKDQHKWSQSQESNSGMISSKRTNTKEEIERRRVQREERRKNKKDYEQVRNEIKYGTLDQSNPNNQVEAQSKIFDKNNSLLNDRVIAQNAEQYEENYQEQVQGQQSKENQCKEKKMDKQTSELANKLRLYEIKWDEMPLIPGQFKDVYNSFPMLPSFTSDESLLIVKAFKKLIQNKINTYSMFFYVFNQEKSEQSQIVGLKQLPQKDKKTTMKSYKLLEKKEFIQKWSQYYNSQLKKGEKGTKDKAQNANDAKLNEDQVQVLIEFDLKWYMAVIKHCYKKQLSEVVELYKGKKQAEYQKHVDTKKFIETIQSMRKSSSEAQHSQTYQNIIEQLTINKLKLLKNLFSNTSLTQEYSFGMISSMITDRTSEQEQTAIKLYLKQNFRGGIYFIDKNRNNNICIMQMRNNKDLHIDQISNDIKKQVWINKKLLINLGKNSQNNERSVEAPLEVRIALEKNSQNEQGQSGEVSQLNLTSYFNQISYQVQSQPVQNPKLNFCTKYQIIVPDI